MSEKVKEEGSFKVKKKPGRPKKLTKQQETIKVDLSKKEDPAEEKVTKVVIDEAKEETVKEKPIKEVVEEKAEEPIKEEKVIPIQEVTEEK